MKVKLYPHQRAAVNSLKNGNILAGGVGSGKSITAIVYYIEKVLKKRVGNTITKKDLPLIIITTAKKRNTGEWISECSRLGIYIQRIDSWNNIEKYKDERAFFIFDEQRVVGSGAWVKHFLKITKVNPWLLLTATPADNWMDLIPTFVANGFYRNRSHFINEHVVYKRFIKYPVIDKFINESELRKLRKKILVPMEYKKNTIRKVYDIETDYDSKEYKRILRYRTLINGDPIENVSKLFYELRKIVNSDVSRINMLDKLRRKHKRIILFYNFNYELDMLEKFCIKNNICYAQYNGKKHEEVPGEDSWIYLVQYTAGAEGWNCINTNVILFFSLNYSYKISEQSMGRIDRINTPYVELLYYRFISRASLDRQIRKAIDNKKKFQERDLKKL